MNGEPVFSPRLLAGWIAGAVAIFAVTLYFKGGGELSAPDSVGPSTFSRSAIGHAGLAEVLTRLGIPVVKSRYNSLEKLAPGSVLVIAEPRPGRQTEEAIRSLLKADTILFVLPKWRGQPSEQRRGWLREVKERPADDAQRTLRLVAPRADVVREGGPLRWTANALASAASPQPDLAAPVQLVRGDGLRPIIASDRGILLGETGDRNRRVWVLSDPDLISNHGLARKGNAVLAVALFERLREVPPPFPPPQAGEGEEAGRAREGPGGSIVFDETVHGHLAKPSNPLALMFRFPFVVATAQALFAVALLMWATMARFGAPRTAPPPLRAGRAGLLQNMAKLIEFTGHQREMVARYVQETVRDVARELHAPRALAGDALIAWLERVGGARGVEVDCGTLVRGARELGEARRHDPSALVRLARDTHRWKGEILDGRAIDPRRH